MKLRHYRYVPHRSIDAYLRLGWFVAADLGSTHGEWRVLMCWPCGCPLVEPSIFEALVVQREAAAWAS